MSKGKIKTHEKPPTEVLSCLHLFFFKGTASRLQAKQPNKVITVIIVMTCGRKLWHGKDSSRGSRLITRVLCCACLRWRFNTGHCYSVLLPYVFSSSLLGEKHPIVQVHKWGIHAFRRLCQQNKKPAREEGGFMADGFINIIFFSVLKDVSPGFWFERCSGSKSVGWVLKFF